MSPAEALARIAGMEWAAHYFTVAARGYAEVPMSGFYDEIERLRKIRASAADAGPLSQERQPGS